MTKYSECCLFYVTWFNTYLVTSTIQKYRPSVMNYSLPLSAPRVSATLGRGMHHLVWWHLELDYPHKSLYLGLPLELFLLTITTKLHQAESEGCIIPFIWISASCSATIGFIAIGNLYGFFQGALESPPPLIMTQGVQAVPGGLGSMEYPPVKAVSYTHLDVYKRQASLQPLRMSIPSMGKTFGFKTNKKTCIQLKNCVITKHV